MIDIDELTESDVIKILEKYGTFSANHTGRTLGDHLINTYRMLVSFNAPYRVCLAGAFHSIYGTNAYKNKMISKENRQKVIEDISEEVENLVYLFSVINRPRGLDSGYVVDYTTQQEIQLDETVMNDLRILEIANLLEQNANLQKYRLLYNMYLQILKNVKSNG